MEIIIIGIAAFAAAILTFFSGFGLGTILTPVFVIFFPVEVAIALTTHHRHSFNHLLCPGDFSIIQKNSVWKRLAAIAGAYLGKRLLKKVTLRSIQLLVAVMLVLVSLAMGSGLI